MAVHPRQVGVAPATAGAAKAAFGPEVAARRVLWRSTLVAVLWIAGGWLTLVNMFSMNGYLRSAMGVPRTSGDNQFMGEFGGLLLLAVPIVCASVIAAALALYTAWRALIAGRAYRRGQRQAALDDLVRGFRSATWTRLTSIILTALTLAYSVPAVAWLFGVSRGGPGAPDAVAGNLTQVEGTIPFVMTGLLAWWLAGIAVSAFHSVISPDRKFWWDGSSWQALTGS
jgi:hypothetical protein